MGLTSPAVVLLVLLPVCMAGHAADGYSGRVLGKKEARIVLNELMKRHVSHLMQRSIDSEIDEEEDDIDLAMIERALERYEERLRGTDTEDTESNQQEAEGGEKLIQEALKGNVDPDSEVVNLLESMVVDEGSRHGQHPEGIEDIASKKGKVFGDTHDSHRLTQQQIEELSQVNGGRKKNFLKSATLWSDNIIPYTIDSSLSNYQRNVAIINKAIQQFSDYTCLKWVPYGSAEANKASYPSYIEFFSGSGCWSYVGRVFSGKQQISLQNPGCVTVSTTVHEMAHAIGQEHEQSRNDRDNYVTMLWSNIQGGTGNRNMAKANTHDYNPYDYESVLQYSLRAFSTNGLPTIEFKDRRLDFLADSATGLMFYDIQDIVDAYKCTEPCRGADGNTPLKQCQNGGFVLHTCNCHCPDGLTGDLCESVATDPDCGPGIIDLANGESRTITSPNFNNGGPYPTGKKCVWLVKVMPGRFVEMTIEDMDLTTAGTACDHWLEIQYNLIGQTGPRRCGKVSKETYATVIHGNPNMMLLKFDTVYASTAPAGKGFNLTVSSVGAGCKTTPCVHGKCTDVGFDGYTCTCESSFSGIHCDIYTGIGDVFCGFETPDCIFRNPQSNSYDWIITSGSTNSSGTGPSGAKTGNRYLHVETSSPVPSGAVFHFDSPYFSAGPKCLSFWYHMYGSDMGTLSVLRNGSRLWTKTGDQGNTWHGVEMNVGTSSQTVKVTFEATKGSGYRSDIAIDDVMLTSALCTGITPSPATTVSPVTPLPTTQTSSSPIVDQDLHCTFEPGTPCFLNNVTTDDFDWRTRQGSTPSSGTGPSSAYEGQLYSYIETTARRLDDVAILESPIITTTQTFCLTFAYHMYGANIGSLSVVMASSNGDQSLFSRNIDEGNQWIVTSISVPPSNGKIRFIGVRGDGYRGDIAVDDVHFVAGGCSTIDPFQSTTTQLPITQTSSPPVVDQDLHCTFEPGTPCFLNDITTDDFDWRTRQGSTPSSGTGPSSAYEGQHYSYIETTAKRLNDVAILQGPDILTSNTYCLSFAYHMYGTDIGSLYVVIASYNGNQTLFSKHSDEGNQWIVASISVPPSNGKIQFIGVRGNGFRGDIAIDDVHFVAGDCYTTGPTSPMTPFSGTQTTASPGVDQEGHCTFEIGTSCFLNNINHDNFDWQIQGGNTPSSGTGPSSAYEGQLYSYIEASGKATGAEAILESQPFVTTKRFCLSFAYHMYGFSTGALRVMIKSPFGDQSLFNKSFSQGNKWIVTAINVPPSNGTFWFIGVRGNGNCGDIAIDDIHFMAGGCSTDDSSPFTTPLPSTLPLSCTFEDGTVCFLHDDKQFDDFDWRVNSGRTSSGGTGPSKAAEGIKYAYIEASGRRPGNRATLESLVAIPKDGNMCLSFDFHMYGREVGSLEVFFQNISYFHELGNKGDQWNKVEISLFNLDSTAVPKIQFTATRGSGFSGDIAIDNVQLTEGECVIDCTNNPCGPNSLCVQETNTTYRCDCHPGFTGVLCDVVSGQANCTFEKGEDCFLENTDRDDYNWLFVSGMTSSLYTGPDSAKQGLMYAYIETSGRRQGDKAKLVTKHLFASGDRCLTFAYHMHGKTIGSLRVLQETNMNTIELFSKFGEQSNSYSDWKTDSIDIYHNKNDTIVFEATRGKSYLGDIAIDDIKYIPGRCACDLVTCKNGGTCLNMQNGGFCQCLPDFTGTRCEKRIGLLSSCTFDEGACFLTNINGQDIMDWLIIKGHTPSAMTGPIYVNDGKYAYIEASGQSPGDNAILSSETSHFSTSGPSCLRFLYNMHGLNIGTLNVYVGERNAETIVWSLSRYQGSFWLPAAIEIPPTNDLVVKIEAIRGNGYRGDIAIDSVQLTDAICLAPPSSLPLSCTFEDGTDIFLMNNKKDADIDWKLLFGHTNSMGTGPSKAAEGSKYAFIEASSRRQGDRAIFERLIPVPADGKICLTFDYHMYGRHMGSLDVLFQNTTYFHESGNKGDQWNKAEVDLNGLASTADPLLQFIAIRGTGFQSDIAIDDVQLTEGQCVVPPPA